MGMRRWLGSAIVLAGVVTLNPAAASADGGAYIDLDRTHFLVGSTGHAETYVSVPADKRHLFDRGPFYLYVTPSRSLVTEGQALPGTAVRVATMTIEHDRGPAFELSASFTVPDLPGDYYALSVCNDPCTISGFREPLTGTISIVRTTREADLLNGQQRLTGRIYGLKRDMRKQERAEADLERRLSYAGMQESDLNATVTRLRDALADARADTRSDGSSTLWLPILMGVGLVAFEIVRSMHRRRPAPVRDVPAMVRDPEDSEPPRVGSFR